MVLINSEKNKSKLFIGSIIHSTSLETLVYYKKAALGVDDRGTILFLTEDLSTVNYEAFDSVMELKESQFLIPGLIDTHTHAPQHINSGTGLDYPLLEWLEKYTFPSESAYGDITIAQNVYEKVVKRHLRNGTTTCCYFGTIHLEATQLLVDLVHQSGQRGFVGKVNMDTNSPEHYIETLENSLETTKKFVEYTLAKENCIVVPVITPRFAPTCTAQLLKGLADLAAQYRIPIQSHLSENKNEVAWVSQLFPNSKSYSDVYDSLGLMNKTTIMAHCIYLSDEERQLIKEKEVGISHCPNSNFSLSSGVLNVRQLLNNDIKVGLGTDISGGYAPSMFDAIRNAITASKLTQIMNPEFKHLHLAEAFYLATIGGAKLLNISDKVGNFEAGKLFDGLLIDTSIGNFDLFPSDTLESSFEKFIYLGDDRNILSVYVGGREV